MAEQKPRKVTIGSRGSELALWQAKCVKTQLSETYPDIFFEIILIKTKGDKILDSSLSKIGGKGIFTKEIDNSLLEGRVDVAVHSLKDLPTQIPAGLTIGATPKRGAVEDVFIAHKDKGHRGLHDLPKDATIATGSLRRKCQLLHYRRDLKIVELRGNVPTRIQKLDESDWDGMILARAGLERLNLTNRITEKISTDILLPAVGQGAMAIEVRSDDDATRALVASLNYEPTAMATSAERTLLAHLEGGCQVPIAAFARIDAATFKMDGLIGSLDGRTVIRSSIHGEPSQAETLSTKLAETLLRGGGEKVLREIRPLAPSEVPAV